MLSCQSLLTLGFYFFCAPRHGLPLGEGGLRRGGYAQAMLALLAAASFVAWPAAAFAALRRQWRSFWWRGAAIALLQPLYLTYRVVEVGSVRPAPRPCITRDPSSLPPLTPLLAHPYSYPYPNRWSATSSATSNGSAWQRGVPAVQQATLSATAMSGSFRSWWRASPRRLCVSACWCSSSGARRVSSAPP